MLCITKSITVNAYETGVSVCIMRPLLLFKKYDGRTSFYFTLTNSKEK